VWLCFFVYGSLLLARFEIPERFSAALKSLRNAKGCARIDRGTLLHYQTIKN
jgi:hypothetical protein